MTSAFRPRRSVWIPALYLLLVALALALPSLAGAPTAGVAGVLLTLPWSLVAVPVLDAIDPKLMDRGAGVALMALGAIVNALLLRRALRGR